MKRTAVSEILLKLFTYFSVIITFLTVFFILAYILIKGLPYLKLSLFALKYNSDNVSMLPSIISTFLMVAITMVISVPLGVATATYLNEYASPKSRIVGIIRLTAETLAGIPSIVYGLFGMLFFVYFLKLRLSVLSGAFTLSIMVLPLIMRTTEEALKSVPIMYREGAFALGAGQFRTVFKIVLPSAMPGIAAGVVLAIGRCVGETAALIYTAGTVPQLPSSVLNSVRTLSVHMWALSGEALHTNEAYATAVVLLLFILIINAISSFIAKRLVKG